MPVSTITEKYLVYCRALHTLIRIANILDMQMQTGERKAWFMTNETNDLEFSASLKFDGWDIPPIKITSLSITDDQVNALQKWEKTFTAKIAEHERITGKPAAESDKAAQSHWLKTYIAEFVASLPEDER